MWSLLMVDDDVLFLQALNRQIAFSELGYGHVWTAQSADEALAVLQHEHVDVLLCDIEMPGKSGMEVVHWVVEQHYPAVILLLTCHSSFSYAQEAIGLNVFDYLLKPIRAEVLQERLTQALVKCNELHWIAAHRQEFSTAKPKEHDTVDRVCTYIEEHIQTELTREQIGRALFMNPDYIARIFREKQGQPLNEYIRSRRVSHAKRLLRETDLPVAEVCIQVGYTYNTYFFNTFKRLVGCSPNEYRNRYRA